MKRPVEPSYRFYKGAYRVTRAAFWFIFRLDFIGKENIPPGAAMICSNHSSMIDPILIAFAFGIDSFIHFLAKVELFRTPVISFIVIKLGAISVNRDMMDVVTLKRTLEYFKNGEKVGIFPEGTRAQNADDVAAKSGAVKIAERAKVPLIPVFIPRRKGIFGKVQVIIGNPYTIEKPVGKRPPEEYPQLAETLMKRIEALDPAVRVTGD